MCDQISGLIEVEINGVMVRVGRGADTKTVAAVDPRLEGRRMIGPTGAVRVVVATKPVDFRKGAEGLAALVRETMQADPFSGAVYVFRAKRADRVKLIYRDGTGVCSVRQTARGWQVPLAERAGRSNAAVGCGTHDFQQDCAQTASSAMVPSVPCDGGF